MKPTFGSAYLDDNLPQFTTIHYSFHVINRGYDINRGHCLRRVVINIRASKNILGLVKVSGTSPAGLIKFFLNVEPCLCKHLLSDQQSERSSVDCISAENKKISAETCTFLFIIIDLPKPYGAQVSQGIDLNGCLGAFPH